MVIAYKFGVYELKFLLVGLIVLLSSNAIFCYYLEVRGFGGNRFFVIVF